ncbi:MULTISPECIES: sensor histidine kinase [Pseudomonas]|uniref:sensor histidine kinase n=1 Tax=Pseudomonadaceae TaxID=135621 RepID=UPI0021147A56|nr:MULTISPECIES: ATP-binding protein [Pseudomonas]MDE3736694.1 ATP-binding protein [Pseudomonas resinovorans]
MMSAVKPLTLTRTFLFWLVLFCPVAAWIGWQDYADRYERFFQDTSIVQRMLSQKTVQHEAVLETLAALSHAPIPERLLPSLQASMPQLLGLGHLRDGGWAGSTALPPALPAALEEARQAGHPVTLPLDEACYWLVAPSGWSLLLDARQLLPATDFPPSLALLTLDLGKGALTLLARQPAAGAPGWALDVRKPLGAVSQPFALHSWRTLTPADWPWLEWLAWVVASGLLVAGAAAWQRSRAEARRRQEEVRLAAMARLNTLGEMAAGLAHELNQPLTAILAQVRAAERLLDDEEERPAVRQALLASAGQARRAADIISRMRELVTPSSPSSRTLVDPDALMASLLFLREDELARRGIRLAWRNANPGVRPLGDRVALEQILHNLVQNAADALVGTPASRTIVVTGGVEGRYYVFSVSDNGPGIPAEALPRLFEPFYSTRPQGMGLGLALCETLAGAMDGRITASNLEPRGARFTLSLPLAGADA